jgi:multidrug transporter EmrE-like cation transporter
MNMRDALLSWGMVGAYVALNSVGALVIKHTLTLQRATPADTSSLTTAASLLVTTLTSPRVILALFAIALSACAWILALSRMELSIAYPVAVALNCLIVVSAGFAAYGEPLTWSKLAGVALLLGSLVLLFRGA